MLIRRLGLEDTQQLIPIVVQRGDRRLDCMRVEILGDDRLDRSLVDHLRARRVKLLILRVLMIPQHKDDLAGLTGIKRKRNVMRANRRPAMGLGVKRLATLNRYRPIPATIRPEKCLALVVKTCQFLGAGEVGKVIAALAVFCLMIDDAILDLDLPGVEVALEVSAVILRIPKAKLDTRKDREPGALSTLIGHAQLPD